VRNALDERENYLLARDTEGQRQLVVVIPLVSNHQTVAILQIGMQITHIDEFLMTFRTLLFIACFGALGVAITLTFPLVGAALRPLVDIERTSRQIAAGALSTRIEPPLTTDEIGRLAMSFNQMVSKLEQSLLRQKRFVADVSHELRTPLAALSGSLEMLVIGADQGDSRATHRLARGMYMEVQRMHRLVEDLLALTRLDEGEMKLRAEEVQVQALLEHVSHQAQQLAHGQTIRCRVAPGMPPAYADRDKLQQILLNLIDNALKFTPSDGIVELEVSQEGLQTVVITIRDTGQGIPPEALPHVCDRFYRADPSRSRQPQQRNGNGLGLAIAKELLEAQKGTIHIASTLGKGTTITVRLRSVECPVPHLLP
jgi:two-component system OmpR family sensor kinase